MVAATAADAERDLRRIIIEYPLSPRNEDALLRLAQLEMTRGDNDQALAHLQRLVIDHPTSPSRARASFWMARVYFDKNQTPAACRSLADAAHNTSAAQVEQRNQIDFWMQRCHGMDTAAVASTAADTAPPDIIAAASTAAAAASTSRDGAPGTTAGTRRIDHDHIARRTTVKSTHDVIARAIEQRRSTRCRWAPTPRVRRPSRIARALAARGIDARIVGTAAPYPRARGSLRHAGGSRRGRAAPQGEEDLRVRDGGRAAVSRETPLMEHWREMKSRNPGAILLYRLGEFYETFYEDAEIASRVLGLTLTSRNNGAAADVPLAGVPAKAMSGYLRQLVSQGYRVAICEQMEDPKNAKGVVRREVVETITPGAAFADDLLDHARNNFLCALCRSRASRRASRRPISPPASSGSSCATPAISSRISRASRRARWCSCAASARRRRADQRVKGRS